MTHEEETRNFVEPDEDYDFDPDGGDRYCYRCDGKGYIITCPDDMCHGQEECIHGDGEMVCPECKGRNLI